MNRRFDEDRAELEAHFAECVQAYRELGETPEQAAVSALQKFGEQEAVFQELKRQRQAVHLRSLVGILGLGLVWGVVWPILFAALIGAILLLTRTRIDTDLPLILQSMVPLGITTGVVSGVLLLLTERGKNLSELSRGRVAFWGALAASLFPLLTGRANQTFWTCAFGAIIAVMLLALAQKTQSPLSHLMRWVLGPVKKPLNERLPDAHSKSL